MWPGGNAPGALAIVPHFFWVEPIPTAKAKAKISMQNTRSSWTCVGGHERLWAAFNWRTCLRNLKIICLEADNIFGVIGTSRGGPAAEIEIVEEGENRITLRRLYDGNGITTEHLNDNVTSMELRLEQLSQQLERVFIVKFKNIKFVYVPTKGRGGTECAGTMTGGRTGARAEQGPAFVEMEVIMKLIPDQALV
ncbi:hypothetical protein F5Y19DRAFT_471399 [Xylariaceae sp. FL1651]|nr:hypothetical protein F5Y19DRAFT_471399 [Xylariaceae sp. FL1651]